MDKAVYQADRNAPPPIAISWVAVCLAAAAVLALVAGPRLGLGMSASLAAAIGIFCMGSWATGALPEIVTALLFFAVATLTRIAPPATIFPGFASSAFWLILSGMVVGLAITQTGLGARIARVLARHLPASYPRFIAGVIAVTYGLSFLMPSNMGRIVLLMPIMLALAEKVGLRPGRRGHVGVVLAVGFGTFMLSTSVLTANVPNLVMVGAAESLYGLNIDYFHYLLLHLPVQGVAKGVVLVVLICLLFPDRLEERAAAAEEPVTPWSEGERRLAIVLAVTLGFWLTDSLHHVAPAWIGLAAAVVVLLPGSGMLAPESFGKINFRTMFYIAALLGLVAVVEETGLGAQLSRSLLALAPLQKDAAALDFGVIVVLASALSFAVTANGEPAMFTPLARDISAATGFELLSVIMIQVIGFSTVFFPYQAPPIVVAMELGGARLADAIRLGMWSGIVTLVVLAPLDFVWWRLLGQI